MIFLINLDKFNVSGTTNVVVNAPENFKLKIYLTKRYKLL